MTKTSQFVTLPLTITAQTDRGPTRQQNEDACYFTSSKTSTELPLTIVCDGMGGHAQGEVASTLASQVIAQQLQEANTEPKDTTALVTKLDDAIYSANDLIHQHNNQQQRQKYQCMGTTLVMALASLPKIYIANVGDSRAYWITHSGCYQVTTDDNMASRCVELGVSFYRDALDYPNGAYLVQALGVDSSKILQPRIRQFVIDEECIFLLCSDGLSDNNRVEESWEI